MKLLAIFLTVLWFGLAVYLRLDYPDTSPILSVIITFGLGWLAGLVGGISVSKKQKWLDRCKAPKVVVFGQRNFINFFKNTTLGLTNPDWLPYITTDATRKGVQSFRESRKLKPYPLGWQYSGFFIDPFLPIQHRLDFACHHNLSKDTDYRIITRPINSTVLVAATSGMCSLQRMRMARSGHFAWLQIWKQLDTKDQMITIFLTARMGMDSNCD